jgi:catalase-peroxidase
LILTFFLGSYRQTDGRGGCDGARIRFSPELSWPDNANLDNALRILEPIKAKYGNSLSWGDLIILTGTTAMENMGLKSIGFCGGRQDDKDGSDSLVLGPSPEQKKISVCVPGSYCTGPSGTTTVGLIYVDAAGHLGVPVPKNSVPDIRRTFANMGMTDRETVALIGGGHAFGKAHGACAKPPCSNGTFTSGFEGIWTNSPIRWTNDYFKNLLRYNFTLTMSPAGKPQWKTSQNPDIFMLTSDLALLEDRTYKSLVNEYAADIQKLEVDFTNAWYKLTTLDMVLLVKLKF